MRWPFDVFLTAMALFGFAFLLAVLSEISK